MLSAAKTYAAFIGSILTTLLGLQVIPVAGAWHTALTITSALCTAIAVYTVPNQEVDNGVVRRSGSERSSGTDEA